MDAPNGTWIGLAVGLGSGLLIGVDRERRKGSGPAREAAGLRSFAIAGFSGALAQTLHDPGLVVAGALLVVVLGAVSHFKSRSSDPGLTTELALFTTYLIGVQAVLAPGLGAACAVGLAALLAARERLHRFATRLVTEQELHDGLLLAALALIALPLIPPGPAAWLGGIEPRPLFAMVVLILGVQAAGHVALRWLGPRAGAALGGFVAGFVSSTATVASCGSRARTHPGQALAMAASGALSGVATWLQALLISSALSPASATVLAPVALAGAAGGLLFTLPLLRRTRGRHADGAPRSAGAASPPIGESALQPRAAVAIALMLGLVALGVGAARRHFGESGLMAAVALAALADSHAPISTLASLHASGGLTAQQLLAGVLLAIGANTLMRVAVAAAAGGPRYALRVGAVLLAGLAAATAAGLL
jgi:uncharacterized membrane protein (DUF4010 family)